VTECRALGGHGSTRPVNNIMYLQYFETARIEYMVRAGLGPPGLLGASTALSWLRSTAGSGRP